MEKINKEKRKKPHEENRKLSCADQANVLYRVKSYGLRGKAKPPQYVAIGAAHSFYGGGFAHDSYMSR